MGAADASIFGDDLACDIRGCYRTLIEDGARDAAATRQTMKAFENYFKGQHGTVAILALALAQSEMGRLDPKIRDLALAAIDSGGDLERWQEEGPDYLGERIAALAAARAQLAGAQPARKRLKRPPQIPCGLVSGDVLAFDGPKGPVLIRVVRVLPARDAETPVVEELVLTDSVLPSAAAIQELPARKLTNPSLRLVYPNTRFVALFDPGNAGWKEAGFRKVAQTPTRAEDSMLQRSGRSIFWSALAAMFRTKGEVPF